MTVTARTEESSQDLRVEVRDRVALLVLNRPKKLNALSADIIEGSISALRRFAQDPEVGAVVLTGEGRAFCAGGDVSSMAAGGARQSSFEERIDHLRAGQEMAYLLHTLPKVTIAAVNGFAMGAGLGIAMSCDLRLASSAARFGTAYAKVGFGGDYGTSWQLTRLLGLAKAKELFFLADIVDAEEALRIGLVNRVLPESGFLDAALEIAGRIAHGPLVSYRYMKENVNLAVDSDFRTILDREAMTHLRCGQTDDHREGVQAFLEKREPRFTGR